MLVWLTFMCPCRRRAGGGAAVGGVVVRRLSCARHRPPPAVRPSRGEGGNNSLLGQLTTRRAWMDPPCGRQQRGAAH